MTRSIERKSAVPQLLSISDVASTCRVSVSTVRRLIKGGQLKAIRINGQWRVSVTALEAYLGLNHIK